MKILFILTYFPSFGRKSKSYRLGTWQNIANFVKEKHNENTFHFNTFSIKLEEKVKAIDLELGKILPIL